MEMLLDTHLLLWVVRDSPQLSRTARALVEDMDNVLIFSAVSVWEIAIKFALHRADFPFEPGLFRQTLLKNGYRELPITGEHTITVASLPPIHKDPFDRLLVAQAIVEPITLLTVDATLLEYPAPVRLV